MWRRAGVLVLVCATLAAITYSPGLHAGFMALLEAARQVMVEHPVWGALLFVLLCAISAMFAFASASFMVPVAFYVWGMPAAIVLMWVGWVIGGACAYTAARLLGRRVMRFLTMQSLLSRLEHHLGPDTPFSLILLFQLAMPSEIPGYVLGLARYSFLKYLAALMIAEIPAAIVTALVGASFVERRGAVIIGIGFGLVVVSVALFQLLRQRLDQVSGR